MKKLKRIFSLMIAAVMVLAMNITVFAADPTYTITINNTKQNVSIIGHTYSAYKIFEASVSADGSKVSYSYDANTCLNVSYTPEGAGEALSGDDLISWLADEDSRTDAEIRAFADYVYETYIDVEENAPIAAGHVEATAETNNTITLSSAGYYLVYGTAKAVDGAQNKDGVVAAVALTTTKPVANVNPKLDAPILEKEIKHNELETWGVVGDNQIGDTVEFRTITSVPDTNGYDTYDYWICDIMGEQITLNRDNNNLAVVSISVNDTTTLDPKYYEVENVAGLSFRIDVDIMSAMKDKVIRVGDSLYTYYSGVLNENALIYDEGKQENEAYLEYSNNPYDDGHGETTHDKVYDWTFKMEVNKVDSSLTALNGAKFVLTDNSTLEPTYNTNGECTNTTSFIRFIKSSKGYTVAPANYTAGQGEELTYVIEGSTALLRGLDDETTYYLHEIEAPSGYNKLDEPVEFTISANDGYSTDGATIDQDKVTVTVDEEEPSSELSTDVINQSGTTLPETGGIGTRIFYAVGAILMIGAAVVLISRKRTSER